MATVGQPSIADNVALILSMVTTIDFNDKPLFAANEVNNIGPNWLLPDKFEST